MSKIDVKITPVEKFSVEIYGQCIGEFSVESRWNGFIKLINEDGTVIVDDERSMFNMLFDGILNKSNCEELTIVKITPSLIPPKPPAPTATAPTEQQVAGYQPAGPLKSEPPGSE